MKLLDFGIAKLSGDGEAPLTSAGSVLGTPAFMAPEQIANVVIDARTDIYATGATMYYALTGRKPHAASTLTALLYAIAHEWPAPLESLAPHIDRSLAAVVGRAMHKDPAGRFASAREMRAALEPWAGARSSLPVARYEVTTTIEAGPTVGPTPGAVAFSSGPSPMPATPPARSSGSAGAIMAAVLAVVLLLGGGVGGTLLYLHARAPEIAAASPLATSSPASVAPSASAAQTASALPSASGSSAAAPSASAGPGAPARTRPRMTGTTAHFSSARYSGTTSKEARPAIDAVMPRVSACHAATELDPPLHDQPSFLITIGVAGNVTSVQRMPTTSQPAHAKYDACVRAALASASFPATAKGASITLGIFAPVPR